MRLGAKAACVALGAALGLVLGTARWPLDCGRLSRNLSADGATVAAPTRATFTLLPRPVLHLYDFRAETAGVSATAASADATLRLGGLLTGRFVPNGLTLHDADIRLDVDVAGVALAGLQTPPLARLVVKSGTVALARPTIGWSTRLEIANANVDWSGPSAPLRAVVVGRWRGQPVDVAAELDAPLAVAQGRSSPLRMSLDAPLLQVRLAGDLAPGNGADLFRGQASALAPSLARLARWFGRAYPEAAPPLGLELAGRFGVSAGGLRLADATLALGGQNFEGALDVARGVGGYAISGTLAADVLDLEPLLGAPPAFLDAAGAWSDRPMLPTPTEGLDLDLRVSAGHAVWRQLSLDNAAAAVSQKQGLLAIKILEAGIAHGALSGEVSVDTHDGDSRTQVSGSLENGDLGILLGAFGAKDFSGQGALKLALRAQGLSPREMIATADGEATLDVADGSVASLNFEEALRRARRRLIDVARDMSAGATHFGAAHGRIEIGGGEARFVDATTQAPGVSLAVTGAIDLAGRAWRAHVAARESADDGHPTPDGARLDFALSGPWSGPVLEPLLPPAD